jgi:hypothetical protein
MFRRNRHPGDETPDDGDGSSKRDTSRKGQKKSRRKSPPLWQPKSESRDVNLEMTPDDLDRSAKSRASPARASRKKLTPPEFFDAPGLGPEWRERIMRRPGPH